VNVDLSRLKHESERLDDDADEDRGLHELLAQARSYVGDHTWCSEVLDSYFGDGFVPYFAVALVRIRPAQPEVDEWLWVIIGDVPPLYLVTDDAPTADDAVRIYIELRDEWVDAVRCGKAMDALAPVNVPPTQEWADELDSRLRLLERRMLGTS